MRENAEIAEEIRKQAEGKICRNCNQTILTFKSAKIGTLGQSSQIDALTKMYCKKCKSKSVVILRNVGLH